MSVQTYNLYRDGTPVRVAIDSNSNLAQARAAMGGNISWDYRFVYWNDLTQQKTFLNEVGKEASIPLSKILFAGNNILLANVSASRPDLFGTKASGLTDRHVTVSVGLNNTDAEGKRANAGKFAPLMLTNVQPANPSVAFFAENVVICEKGSLVNFYIRSWGAAGFGYSISSPKQKIASSLFITFDKKSFGTYVTGFLSRYESSKRTIQVDSTQSLNIAPSLILAYQKITVKTWNIRSYQRGSETFTSNLKPPPITGAGGDTITPGSGVQTGATHQGPGSDMNFYSLKILSADDPDNTVLGAVTFHFFVFRDANMANNVLKVLNSPNLKVF